MTKHTDDIVSDALERFEESNSGSEHNRQAYQDDFRFARLEEQWPDDVLNQRIKEGRPALVINKLPTLIRSVVNESRQNKPAIRVSPVDGGADEDTAEVISGLIRSIERNSSASVAYNHALEQAVTGGMGFFRIGIDYVHADTFDMQVNIDRIPNALQVHYDVTSTRFDASDWDYGFISQMLTDREFKFKYPNASKIDFEGSVNDNVTQDWGGDDEVRVAEYFLREDQKRTILELSAKNPQTGENEIQVVREDDLIDIAKQAMQSGGIDISGGNDKGLIRAWMQANGIEETRRREAEFHKVTRRIMSGREILEEEEWAGSMIPICPVWGEEIFMDGRRHFRSMIRSAKDSQMMFNFWRSATTELVALAPRTPFIGPKGFIPKGDETKWKNANTRSHAYLEYEPSEGPPPSRQAFAGVPAGALQESLSSNDDMKAITGIFDSSIGARSNEISGKAILARERQGNISNFHFIDNLNRAIRYCGEVLVDIIPSVYSEQSAIRVLGEDETQKIVSLSDSNTGGSGKLYDIGTGRYDVTVSTGPTFSTQREETREALIEIMSKVPDAAALVGDVLLDNMDFPGADKVSKRLNSLLPPEIRESEQQDGEQTPEEAQLKAALQAKDQEIQNIQQQVQQAQEQVMQEAKRMTDEIQSLKYDKQFEDKKLEMESSFKDRELKIKEAELRLKALEQQNALV